MDFFKRVAFNEIDKVLRGCYIRFIIKFLLYHCGRYLFFIIKIKDLFSVTEILPSLLFALPDLIFFK